MLSKIPPGSDLNLSDAEMTGGCMVPLWCWLTHRQLLSRCMRWKRWKSLMCLYFNSLYSKKAGWGFLSNLPLMYGFYRCLPPSTSCVRSTCAHVPDSCAEAFQQPKFQKQLQHNLTCAHIYAQTHLCVCWWPPPWWMESSPRGHFLSGCHGYSLSSVRRGAAPKPARRAHPLH